MNLVERAKNIVLSPKSEWEVIAGEASSVPSIYTSYLVILAAIPVVAGFIGSSVVGVSIMGASFRVPLLAGIANMVVSYALSLAMVYVIALIADALAPNFQGQKNFLSAFKLIAFCMTPGMLAGVFSILPSLAILGLLASLYGVYVLYLGVPTLMKVPKEKAVAYTAVLVVCVVVASIVIGVITTVFSGNPMHGMRTGALDPTGPATVSITTPEGKVEINTGKVDEMNSKLEEASKKMEAAEKSGDTDAAGKAALEALAAVAAQVKVEKNGSEETKSE